MDLTNKFTNPNRLVRDLRWAVNSPSLIVSADNREESQQLTLDLIDPDHLAKAMHDQQTRRVGHYFEALLHYWLTHIRRVEMVAHSLQIRENKRTLGEIDFIFRDEQGRLTHWEVAVKFYLCFPGQTKIKSHFIGPNARDTFERKMSRLFDHQLPLSQTHFPDVEVRQAWVKGQIFYDPDAGDVPSTPPRLSPGHLRGTYLRCKQLEWIEQSAGHVYQQRRKPNWLSFSSINTKSNDLLGGPKMASDLRNHFAQTDTPVLLSKCSQKDGQLIESERIFVVSDHWPDDAPAR